MVTTKHFTFPTSSFIGFDHLWDEITKLQTVGDNSYPRHNVVKHSDTEYSIELALAGYGKNEIEVELKEGILIIKGEPAGDGVEYLDKGISTKRFTRTFRLSEHVVVDGADFKNGLLVIDLKVEIPEEKRPRKIQIGTKHAEKRLLSED